MKKVQQQYFQYVQVAIVTGQAASASLEIEDLPEEEPLKKKSSEEEEEEEGEVVKPKDEVKKKRKVIFCITY